MSLGLPAHAWLTQYKDFGQTRPTMGCDNQLVLMSRKQEMEQDLLSK